MRTDASYRYVKITTGCYEPKRMSPKKAKLFEGIKRRCLLCRGFVNNAERLLFDYNKKRCSTAPFFYEIARCLQDVAEDDSAFKGVAIDFKKQKFKLDKLRAIQREIVDLQKFSMKTIFFKIFGALAIAIIIILSLIGNIVAKPLRTVSIVCFVSLLVFSLLAAIIFPIMVCSTIVEGSLHRRLRGAIKDRYLEYAERMYDRLQYAHQRREKRLYDIQKHAEDRIVYYITENICKANRSRVHLHTIRSECLLSNSTV